METHDMDLSTKHTCRTCGLTFNCSSTFTRHKDVHSEAHRFVCAQCGTSYKQYAALKRHQVLIHNAMSENIVDKNEEKDFSRRCTLPSKSERLVQKAEEFLKKSQISQIAERANDAEMENLKIVELLKPDSPMKIHVVQKMERQPPTRAYF